MQHPSEHEHEHEHRTAREDGDDLHLLKPQRDDRLRPEGGQAEANGRLADRRQQEGCAVAALDASGLREVAELVGDDLAVVWSPDSQWLAVSGAYGLSLLEVADGLERDLSTVTSFGGLDWR